MMNEKDQIIKTVSEIISQHSNHEIMEFDIN